MRNYVIVSNRLKDPRLTTDFLFCLAAELYLSQSMLRGPFISELGLLPRLSVVDFDLNQLTGTIGAHIDLLNFFSVSRNSLSGPLISPLLLSNAGTCYDFLGMPRRFCFVLQ